MKRLSLSILTILALVAALPLMAQTAGEGEERTNPDAPSVAADSGLTLQGTVTSWNEKEIVLDTLAGTQHLVLTGGVGVPAGLSVGDEVAIDYTRNSQGTMIANEVRLMGDAEASVQASAIESEAEVTASAETSYDAEESSAQAPAFDEEEESLASADDLGDDELPATAGNEPLLLLLGLVAVGGAAGVRALAS